MRRSNHLLYALALAVTIPAFAVEPAATQPAGPSPKEINAAISDSTQKLSAITGSIRNLADPAIRAKIAPAAVPVIQKIVGELDQLAIAIPDAKADATADKFQMLSFAAILGDAHAAQTLKEAAASSDKSIAETGQLSVAMVDWFVHSGDAAAQTDQLNKFEAKVKAAPTDDALVDELMLFHQYGATTSALADRAMQIIVDDSNAPSSQFPRQLMQQQQKLAALENHPLTIDGKTLDGQAFSTAAWKGKVVLVDFWATWCRPCREEIPTVEQIYADNHDKGLEIIGVSNDQDAGTLKAFLAQNPKMVWPQLFEANDSMNPILAKFGIDAIPTMFLIDRNGTCRSVNAFEKMDELLPKLLAEKPSK
jgi:thiol-disulfide isomerase/thioredoxin